MLFAYSRVATFSGQESFAATHVVLRNASEALAGALALAVGRARLRTVLTLPAARLWGRATALCGESFAHQVAAHLCRKLSLMIRVLAEDEAGSGDAMLAARLRGLSGHLEAAASTHGPKGLPR